MRNQNVVVISLYGLWTLFALWIAFAKNGLNNDNLTRMAIVIFFIVQIIFYVCCSSWLKTLQPKKFFVTYGLFCAALNEGFYMISKPVFDSVLVTFDMSAAEILKKYMIDLAFTIPVYFVVLSMIWWLANRYRYQIWQYMLLMSLGQTFGDGGFFYMANPGVLILLPYTMLNYISINFIPYLVVREKLNPIHSHWKKYFLPLFSLVGIYWIGGALIIWVGVWFGLRLPTP